MPYARRRKNYRKRTPGKPQEKRIRKVVKSELKKEIEAKWYDRVSTGNADNASLAVVNPCTGLVRGTGVSGYIGSSIKPIGLEIRGQLIAADPPGNTMRMIIIQDKTTSTVPTINTMFNTALGAAYIYCPLNKDFTDTFRVLKDKVYLLTNDGAAASNFLPRNFRIFISAKKLRKLTFTTVAGNADSGSIWICFVSDSAVAANPTWGLTTRLNYTDA